MKEREKDNVVIYEGVDGKVELRADVQKDTIWATRIQISQLFETTPQNITIHLGNIYKEGELDEKATSKESLLVQKEGNKAVKRRTELYNLDAVIAVGYRINSKKATQFRIWATRILREYLVAGYSLNSHRLENHPETMPGLYEAVSILKSKDTSGRLRGKIIFKMTQDLIP